MSTHVMSSQHNSSYNASPCDSRVFPATIAFLHAPADKYASHFDEAPFCWFRTVQAAIIPLDSSYSHTHTRAQTQPHTNNTSRNSSVDTILSFSVYSAVLLVRYYEADNSKHKKQIKQRIYKL